MKNVLGSQKKWMGVVPPEGHTFEQLFAEKNYFFKAGEGENSLFQAKRILATKDIELVDLCGLATDVSKEVQMIIYFGRIDFHVLKKYSHLKQIYFAFEPPCVDSAHSEKRLRRLAKHFDYICTWNDVLVNKENFIKFNYVVDFTLKKLECDYKERKLVTNISANKRVRYPNELYSKRLEAIKYFALNEPSFEFYGIGWESENLSHYRGSAPSKRSVLSQYKFSICYENQSNVEGYITEKIWECMICGCVPVYWGANNIKEYVPSNCFIDYRDFGSLESLHEYLRNIPEDVWNDYIKSIDEFIQSVEDGSFSPAGFVSVIEDLLNKDKRIQIGLFQRMMIRLIKAISKIESVYRRYGIRGTISKYKDRRKG